MANHALHAHDGCRNCSAIQIIWPGIGNGSQPVLRTSKLTSNLDTIMRSIGVYVDGTRMGANGGHMMRYEVLRALAGRSEPGRSPGLRQRTHRAVRCRRSIHQRLSGSGAASGSRFTPRRARMGASRFPRTRHDLRRPMPICATPANRGRPGISSERPHRDRASTET